jgi:hypothetical protein
MRVAIHYQGTLYTPENIDYPITQFILRQAFNQWSDNCNITFEFKQPKIPNNLIKHNLRAWTSSARLRQACRFPKYCQIFCIKR